MDAAIRHIEANPGKGGLVAPANSRNPGVILDLSASPYGIFYKVADHGAVVYILKIQPVIF